MISVCYQQYWFGYDKTTRYYKNGEVLGHGKSVSNYTEASQQLNEQISEQLTYNLNKHVCKIRDN